MSFDRCGVERDAEMLDLKGMLLSIGRTQLARMNVGDRPLLEKPSPTRQRAGGFEDARGKSVILFDPHLLHRLHRHDVFPA